MPIAREEAFSFYTHLAGALAALVGLALLVVRAHGVLATTAFVIYGATLLVMFSASALHHVVRSEAGWTRRLDHVSIFLFIAGTYTPFCLVALPGTIGYWILALVWTLALAGIAMKIWLPFAPRWITVALYIALGWSALLAAKPIAEALPSWALELLLAGGAVYTVGAVVYAAKRPDPWPRYVGFHGLWHVFVLVGAGLHFALVWLYVAA